MSKIFTVTIPSYNIEKYLDEILPTYLDERLLEDIELLIVNDGSKDSTAEIGKRYEEQYPGTVRLINKENGGHGSTINTGIKEASGRYFKVIDGDDWVDTEELVKFIAFLKTADTDIVLTPFNRVIFPDKKIERESLSIFEEGKVYQLAEVADQMGEGYRLHSATFKTEIIRKIPPISEHCFYVDQEYIILPLQFAKTVSYANCCIYQYRFGIGEQSVSMANRRKNIAMHVHVTLKLAKFVTENQFSEKVKIFLKNRIAGLAVYALEAFLTFEDTKVAKEQWCDLYKKLAQIDKDYIKLMPGKKAALLRSSNNALFSSMSAFKKKGN
ncbi:MAG: glycosyltransferase family 2 protein [Oscillospiraceae bacterium]|nr:glycosyltransferase family 2 protein [Oscillospiraceae bacterium]